MVDLLREDAAHDRAPMLERDRGMVSDRRQQRSVVVGERRVTVADELADLAPLPPQRQPDRVRAGPAFRPRDVPVLQHERGTRRSDGLHRRLDDRFERLLEVQRLRHGFGDLRQRLELSDAPLRVGVQLCVHDRLRDLRRNRGQQLDLAARKRTGRRWRARIGTARIDSYSSSGRLTNALKRGSRCACAAIITGARSAAAAPVMPSPGRMRGRRVMSSTFVPCVARSTSSPARSS